MAKIVELDENKAREEEITKGIAEVEETERQAALDRFKKDSGMQKYIVEEIFNREVAKLGDIDSIPIGDDHKVMGDLVVINYAARAVVKAILSRLA